MKLLVILSYYSMEFTTHQFHHFSIRHVEFGAVGLACVRNAQLPTRGRTVVVVLTGGNIDMPVLQSILAAAQGSAA